MKRRLIKLPDDIGGATAIEYGLVAALIVIAAVAGISALGGTNGGLWGNMAGRVENALTES